MKKGAKVLVNGWFGPGNAGDEAILSAKLDLLNQHNASVVVAAADQDAVKRNHSVATIPEYNQDPNKWKEVAATVDHVIIGGGGLIESNNIAYKWSRVVAACHELQVPVHFVGVGVTPPISKLHKQLYRDTLNHATSITVRDNASRERLLDLNVTRPISVKPDLAFHHSYTTLPTGDSSDTDRLLVVLRDVPWLPVDLDGLATAVNQVYDRTGCSVEVAGFYDSEADHALLHEFTQKVDADATITSATGFRELEQIIANSRYVIGMRLHSIVFAAKHGVPFLSVAYNPKCQFVPRHFGYENVNWCVDIQPESVADAIISSWSDGNLRQQLADDARDQQKDVKSIFENLGKTLPPMSRSVRYRLWLLPRIIRVEQIVRRQFGLDRPPAPRSVIPDNPRLIES